jgi:hypothetical protein
MFSLTWDWPIMKAQYGDPSGVPKTLFGRHARLGGIPWKRNDTPISPSRKWANRRVRTGLIFSQRRKDKRRQAKNCFVHESQPNLHEE